LVNRQQYVGKDRADHEINLVALEKALDLGDGGIRLQFVISDDDLDILAAHLAAEVLDRERKAVAYLSAQRRSRSRQCDDHADLDLVLRVRRSNREQGQKSCQPQTLPHHSLLAALARPQ